MWADGRVLMALVMLGIFVGMVLMATAYPPEARLLPFVIGIPGSVLALFQLGAEVLGARRQAGAAHEPAAPSRRAEAPGGAAAVRAGEDVEAGADIRREIVLLGYLVALLIAVLLFGFWIAIPLFLVAFLRFHERESWTLTLALTGGAWITLYVVFERILEIFVFEGFLPEYLFG